MFTLYPALDVRQGRIVRLRQGDYAQQTDYGDGVLATACAFEAAGAHWLHLVDLDAARTGGYSLLPLVAQLRQHTSLHIQSGGGIRRRDDVARLLDHGVSRVVIGSMAVRHSQQVIAWLHDFGPERLTIALDARQTDAGRWELAVDGWTHNTAKTLETVAQCYADASLRHLLCTDIGRDGMLCGPNLLLYSALCQRFPALSIQLSGGVRATQDIAAARAAGCCGVVVGKALLDDHCRIEDALVC